MKHDKAFRVVGVFDTETTNLIDQRTAFVVCYIVNDLRNADIETYTPADDDIRLYRQDTDMHAYLDDLVRWGLDNEVVPIVTAYNLMFDLQTLLFELNKRYIIKVLAQSSTHVYTLDLCNVKGDVLLRFWDTFYLDMRGLAAMGESCGLPKALGDWDYSLVRSLDTPLTEQERHYAARDVQVIPMYLRWLIETNTFITSDMLGVNVLTKTSIVRQFGRNVIGILECNGKSLSTKYRIAANMDEAKNYDSYALRKACFRGGLTFTSANYAMQVQTDVISLDVTSMHHGYINHCLPYKFDCRDARMVRVLCERARHTTRSMLYSDFSSFFQGGFNARIEFTGLRLKAGSAFERYGIGTLAESKFKRRYGKDSTKDANRASDETARDCGYVDTAYGARFAFSKLISAKRAVIHLTEIEFWIVCQVYEFDSYKVLDGECTFRYGLPCDYVTLQSNLLYKGKSDVKRALKSCKSGISYAGDLPDYMPPEYIEALRDGTMDADLLESWYVSTLKGMFNGIYGVQAMDTHKPDFLVLGGRIGVDRSTVANEQNYEKSKNPVIYNYGSRIVAGSRLHLVCAIADIYDALGDSARVLGGDTDSIKVALSDGATPDDVMQALNPLHDAIDKSKGYVISRLQRNYPDLDVDAMSDVGHFELETYPDGCATSKAHMECWNKARIDVLHDGHVKLTCAGLTRLQGRYNVDDAISDLVAEHGTECLPDVFGFNMHVDYNLCHMLERTKPEPKDRVSLDVTDYRGISSHVDAYAAICLYPSARVIGDTNSLTNAETFGYLRDVCGLRLDAEHRFMTYDGKAQVNYFDGRQYDGRR